MKYFLIIFFLFAGFITQAQQNNLVVNSNIYLDSLVEKNSKKNKFSKTIQGYRIQIFSGSERILANEIKTKFTNKFNNYPVYLIYQQPYFKVRAGDFRNKIEAMDLYKKLLDEFGEAIIIQDKINFPKL